MRRALILTVGLIMAALGLATTFRPPVAKLYAGEAAANPTVVVRLPMFAVQPTSTPTPTPTATQTAVPTNTAQPSGVTYPVSTGHLSGGISWVDQEDGHPKDHYYMNIEYIKFYHWLFNDSGGTMERYKILGVNVTWPAPSRTLFHTSWTTAPDYVAPHCYGPQGNTLNWDIGLRCGGDWGSGRSEDQIGGNNDVRVDTPGWYTLQYYVCQSATVDECHQNGEWHPVGGAIQFRADPPPPNWHFAPAPYSGDVCRLVMTGQERGRLECGKQVKRLPMRPSIKR